MRVVSILNQKGGCGKTTTAINLAAVLARDGVRTLLVDMDPQSHCAAGLGVPEQGIERTIADAMLLDEAASLGSEHFVWEVARNLRLAPSSVALAALEAPNGPLAARLDRDRRLARALAAWRDEFDWCVIDCPPTIGLLTFNALRAADLVLVPVETGYFSLKGAERQIQTIQSVVARFGREIPFRLLPTLVNDRRPLSRDVVAALEKRFPESMLPLVIREHDELRDAASFGQAITEFAPDSEAEREFAGLARWLVANGPSAKALDHVAGAQPPTIEILASAAPAPTEADAPRDRAGDLTSRLGALSRAKSGAHGSGFGVRATREGIVVFTQPCSPRSVSVVGDFNDWNPDATPLAPSRDGARLEAVVVLPAGRHAYRIVTDGEESLDEFNAHRGSTAEGDEANLVEVPVRSPAGDPAAAGDAWR
jgi:chromosome partitioning protein